MKTYRQILEDVALSAPVANTTTSVPISKEPVVTKKKQRIYKNSQFTPTLSTGTRKIKSIM